MSAAEQFVISGEAVFSHIMSQDEYMGQTTGYSLTVTLDPASAEKLESQGVKLKEYEGTLQKKFTSKFAPMAVDLDDNVVREEIPRGSKVRILTKLGENHPQWGTKAYLNRIRVVEMADTMGGDVPDEF